MRPSNTLRATLFFIAAFGSLASLVQAKQLLVADRLSNSVYRYNSGGVLLGTALVDNVNISQATGLALSPDQTKLFVASAQNSRVMQYDYSVATGTATNPVIFAEGALDGLSFPSSILFSQDGNRIYVSNLGGTGIAQFNTDGSSAGPAITGLVGGGSVFQFSGLAFAPGGELLVGGFQDFPAGTSGAVAKSNAAISTIADFVAPAASLNGASGLLVNGDHLYVTGLFAGNIQRFDAATGAVDPSFNVSGLAFPQGLAAAPDGNGLLVGILGFAEGEGNISRYDFSGNLLGVFATPSANGFTEATAFAVVTPEPTTIGLALTVVALSAYANRRRSAG